MVEIANTIATLAREAWVAIGGIIVAVVMLLMLARILQGTAGAAIGGSNLVASSLVGVVGLAVIALAALIAVPEIARAGYDAAMSSVGTCGWSHPVLGDLATASAMIVGAIGALRMMTALFQAAAGAVVGGSNIFAQAFVAIAETLLGMLIASAALPLVQRLLMC